jgi:hypothetical protein
MPAGGITRCIAEGPYEQTVAAALRPILRKCVYAVLGAGQPAVTAAKDGNATLIYGDLPFLHEEMRSSGPRQSLGGGRPNTEQSRPTDKTGEIAPHRGGF